MKLYPIKIIRIIEAHIQLKKFVFFKTLFGFEKANMYYKRCSKKSILLILQQYGAIIGDNCDIETGLNFHNCTDYSNLKIGNNCHIGKNCFFDLKDKITIENNVTISMGTSLITHQDFGASTLGSFYSKEHNPIIIRRNVYIGANVTILKGVEISKNSILAAGSVINKNVLENIIVGGIPARLIKHIDI